MAYNKIIESIINSAIWSENYETRILFITLLAMSNEHGEVHCRSIKRISAFSAMDPEAVEKSIKVLASPNDQNNIGDDKGRMIREAQHGYDLLCHDYFQGIYHRQKRKDYNRIKQAEFRNRKKESVNGKAKK